MCPNLKYKKVVAINLKKIIFRALKKNFIKNFAVRFFLQRKQYLILNTTVPVRTGTRASTGIQYVQVYTGVQYE